MCIRVETIISCHFKFMNSFDNKKYYEIEENWEKFKVDAELQQKIDLILSIIPKDVRNILDVGCGNGLITNELGARYSAIGLDRSQVALSYVTGSKINAQANILPLQSKSVDLVFSSELLEHLNDKVLQASIQEMQRVAKSYLLVSVPNQEMLQKNALKCPICKTIFNVSYHLQSFNHQRIKNLFTEFVCTEIHEVGPKWRRYVPFLLSIRQKLGNGWFKIPPNRKVMCPNCENTDFPKFKMNPIIFICDGVNKILKRRRPYWLLAIYLRKR